MMKEQFPENLNTDNLSEDEKKALGVIEGRPDLFKTKILEVASETSSSEKEKQVLVATRDPGSAGALLPVMKELQRDKNLKMTVATDGRAQELIEKNFKTINITPGESVLLGIAGVDPDVILTDASDEMGIEACASATFPDIPKVLVEDYYSSSAGYLTKLIEQNLPLPDKICVMDEGAREILARKFPALSDRIEVTGQPIFDKFAHEDTKEIAKEARDKLGLKSEEKLVSFMSTMDGIEKIRRLASALAKAGSNFRLAFRRHPRDNISYADYKKIFDDAGVETINTDNLTTDEVGAASDVVLTTWSTVGLDAIYRRKPTANIIDFDYPVPDGYDFPLASVKLGASAGIDHIEQVAEILPQLLDKKSATNARLSANMTKYYVADGQNAKRVAGVVNSFIKEK